VKIRILNQPRTVGLNSRKPRGSLRKLPHEGVCSIQDRPIESGRPRLDQGQGGRHTRRRRRSRGGAPLPAAIELVGVSESCPSDHRLTRGVHESKEEVGGVLTERKMKAGVDQGQLVARKGGRLLPVKFGDEQWVSRGPNKGENGARKVPTMQWSSATS
jgi:hypothetical protein